MTEDELEKAAVDAIRSAAERLGVDPFRLARFLSHGRMADYLQALGRTQGEIDGRETTGLSGSYLDFLHEETRHRDRQPDKANGGDA